jgi:hypothetical protein
VKSQVFLLSDSAVWPLAHDRYVALVRGETTAAEFAGQRLILVDWYQRMECGEPGKVINETCSWLVFDTQGAVDAPAAHAIQAAAAPTEAQWAILRAVAFPNYEAATTGRNE